MNYEIYCVCYRSGSIVGYGVITNGVKSCFTRKDIIDNIKIGNSFYTSDPQTGKRANVIIEGKIIKTGADGDKNNNLSSLPKCTDCSCY